MESLAALVWQDLLSHPDAFQYKNFAMTFVIRE
jgi:hypothetical protein